MSKYDEYDNDRCNSCLYSLKGDCDACQVPEDCKSFNLDEHC